MWAFTLAAEARVEASASVAPWKSGGTVSNRWRSDLGAPPSYLTHAHELQASRCLDAEGLHEAVNTSDFLPVFQSALFFLEPYNWAVVVL